jgi:NAD(P)-dependent dehydrogenase (short-subunit alcohol dehydrogenase family)
VVTDVARRGDCARLAETAATAFGGIDLLVYTVGYSPLCRLRDTDVDEWQRVFLTNVIGAAQVIQAVLPVMAPAGIIAALSSETVGRPRLGLGPYAASKAALEESLRSWRLEEPQVRFCTVTVGATLPTEFGDHYDAEVLLPALVDWARGGTIQEYSMPTDALAGTLVGALAAALPHPEVGMETIRLRSPAPAIAATSDVATVITYASRTTAGRAGATGAAPSRGYDAL